MDPRTIEVEHRLDELRRCSAGLRAERDAGAAHEGPITGIRLALGRRLVAVGTALQNGPRTTAGNASH